MKDKKKFAWLEKAQLIKVKSLTGFTFIEILLAMALFSVVAVTMYSLLGAGMEIWKRGQYDGGLYQQARLTLNMLARELKNAPPVYYKKLDLFFEGENNKISFPSLINAAAPDKESQFALGRVSYFLEQSQGRDFYTLKRWEESFTDIQGKTESLPEILAVEVKDLKFQYYYEKKEGEEVHSQWQDEWLFKEKFPYPPRGVRMFLTLIEKDSSQQVTLMRQVYIPMGKPGELNIAIE